MATKKINKKTAKKAPAKELITKNMPIGDVVSKYPGTVEVFGKHGLHCIGCAIASFESVEQGAKSHGVKVDALLKDLNAAAKEYEQKRSAPSNEVRKKKKTAGHEGCSCCGH